MTYTLAILPTFLIPALAVAGAAAMSVPIIIHILSRRPRKPVPWAAMRFVLAAYRRHRVRTRFEQYLLLAVRCLLLLLIGLALAGMRWSPAAAISGLGGGRNVILVVDNSLTSEARSDAGKPRFEQLKVAAEKILASLETSDHVALLTASHPVASPVWPPTSDPGSVRRALAQLQPVEAAADLPGALKLLTQHLEQAQLPRELTYIALLSDFSAGSTRIDQPLPKSLARLGEMATLLAPAPAPPAANVQIEKLDPDRSVILAEGKRAGVIHWSLRLRRFAPAAANQISSVRFTVPGAGSQRIDVRWQPGQMRSADLAVTTLLNEGTAAGLLTAEASLEHGEGDALEADNVRRALVRVKQKLGVLLVSRTDVDADVPATPAEPGSSPRFTPRLWLTTALAPVADRLGWPIEVREQDASTLEADLASLAKTDVAIILRPDLLTEPGWAALRPWIEAGGLAWFIAPANRTATLWPNQLATTMGLRWSIASEPVKHDPPLTLALAAPPPAELAQLRADWADLLRPVTILQRLPIDAASLGGGTDLMLAGSAGQPLLIGAASPRGRGRVLFLAAAIDDRWTNLPTKPLFVPLLHELLRATLNRLQPPASFQPGDLPTLTGPTWTNAPKLITPDNTDLLLIQSSNTAPNDASVPAPFPLINNQQSTINNYSSVRPIRPLDKPGLYRSDTDALVVNVDPDAANTAALEPAPLTAWLGTCGTWRSLDIADPAAMLRRVADESDLGWPLLWAVLALALIETALARHVSHAGTHTRTEGAADLTLRRAA